MNTIKTAAAAQSIKGCHVIQLPSGRFGFAGHVPQALAFEMLDGSPVSDELFAQIKSFGAGLFKSKARAVSFATEAEAVAALAKVAA